MFYFPLKLIFEILELLPHTPGNITRPVNNIFLVFVFLDPKCFRLSQYILFASALNWECIFSGSILIFCLPQWSWSTPLVKSATYFCHTWHFLAGFIGDPTGQPQS